MFFARAHGLLAASAGRTRKGKHDSQRDYWQVPRFTFLCKAQNPHHGPRPTQTVFVPARDRATWSAIKTSFEDTIILRG